MTGCGKNIIDHALGFFYFDAATFPYTEFYYDNLGLAVLL